MLPRWACLCSWPLSYAFCSKLYNQMPWSLSSPAQCCATCCVPACFLQLYSVTCWWGKHPDGCQPYSRKGCAASSPRTAHNSTEA